MKRWALIATAIAALLGAGVASLSTYEHFRIAKTGLEEKSFCAISETINCDIVNASSYSEFMGIPISALGVTFYLLIAALSIAAILIKRDAKAPVAVAWFMSIVGVLYSAYLAYVAIHILGVVCIECLSMYAVNIALFIFLFLSLGIPIGGLMKFVMDYINAVRGKASALGFRPLLLRHAIIVIAFFFAGTAVIKGIQAGQERPGDRVSNDEKVMAFYLQSLYPIDVDPDWAVWGNPTAKVTVVEYSEFQCPFCRIAAFNLKPRLQEFKKDVRFYFVNFPLDQACNDSIEHPMHEWACLAAKAGICAKARGDFWSFHDDIFRNQKKLSDETILSLADKRGWNRDEFQACIDSHETLERVKKDIASGRKIYVSGTPTIFVNDRKLKYWSDPDYVQEVVKEEIKRAKK